MADYIASLLLAYQGKVDAKLNAAETREIENPILVKALGYADLALGPVKAEDIRQSDKRTVYTYILNKQTSSGGTARQYAPTGTQSNSTQAALTWVTFTETFQLFAQTGMDNVFATQVMLEHQLAEKQKRLRERVGQYIVQQLHTNRTQVARSETNGGNGGTKLMTWDNANFVFTNSSDQSAFFWENAQNVMKQCNYYGKFDAIADALTYKSARFLQNQSVGNAVNYDYQFADYNPGGIMFHTTLGTAVAESAATPNNGTAILLPTGDTAAFSVIPWIPLRNRMGDGDYTTYNGGFGTLSDDSGVPYTYAVRGWAQKADGSGNGSVSQDTVQYMELSVDIAFLTAPITTANETPIIEFVQN